MGKQVGADRFRGGAGEPEGFQKPQLGAADLVGRIEQVELQLGRLDLGVLGIRHRRHVRSPPG
jgi:hypothetical protein